jgi:adenylyl-sulfate kinase
MPIESSNVHLVWEGTKYFLLRKIVACNIQVQKLSNLLIPLAPHLPSIFINNTTPMQTLEQSFALTQQLRETLTGHPAKVIWLTGLSGAGKSTIANALELKLHEAKKHTYILDGDNVRKTLNKDLGFLPESRSENIRRIAEVALMMKQAGLIVIVTCISPFNKDRVAARNLIGDSEFVEVYLSTPLSVCEQRDPKGLYKKSRLGQLPNMTGIDSPYEVPQNPALTIDTSLHSVQESVSRIIQISNLAD